MKIEIDLDDILENEGGVESLQAAVYRQITDALTDSVRARVKQQLEEAIALTIKSAIADRVPVLMAELLESEYTTVDRYGQSAGKATTLRAEIVAALREQLAYKCARYDHEKNHFSKAVDATIAREMASFQAHFNSLVTEQFTRDAMEYAVAKLRQRLAIPQ